MRSRPVAVVLCLALGCHFTDKHPMTTIALGTTVFGGGLVFGACMTHDDASTCAVTAGAIDAGVLALIGLGYLYSKLGSHDSSSSPSSGDDDGPSVYSNGGGGGGGGGGDGEGGGGDGEGGGGTSGGEGGGDGGGGTVTVDPGGGHTEEPDRDPNGCVAKLAEERACRADAARQREACNPTIDNCKMGCINTNTSCMKGTNNASQIKACGAAQEACLSACNDACKPQPCPHYTECIGGQTQAQ